MHGSADMTFQSLYDIFIKDMASRYKESTVDGHFGTRALNSINSKDIHAWQTEMINKGYSDAYLLRINNMIASIFNFAVSYYDLPSNPCHKAGSI